MAPNPRVAKAFRAMRQIGIAEEIVKPVLKSLLKLYEKNWELIEEENYRALADAIFDAQDSEAAETKKKLENPEREVELEEEEAQVHEEPERPLKRLRLRHQEAQAVPSAGNSSLTGHHQPESRIVTAFPESNSENARCEPQPVSPRSIGRIKGKQPISPNVLVSHERSSALPDATKRIESDSTTSGRLKDKGKEPLVPQEKTPISARPSTGVRFKEPKQEPGVVHSPKPKALALIKPKDEPVTDDMPCNEVPLAVILPESLPKENLANGHDSVRDAGGFEPPTSKSCAEKDSIDEISASCEKRNTYELAVVSDKSTANIEIASSVSGEVKISLSCKSALGEIPNPDEVLKTLEDKYLRSYKILDPNFSVKNLLKDMCDCFLELGSDSTNQPQVDVNVTPPIDLLKKCCAADAIGTQSDDAEILKVPPPSYGVDDIAEPIDQNGLDGSSKPVEQNGVDDKPVEQNGVVDNAEHMEQNGVSDMAVDNNENELESEQNEDADEDEGASCQSLAVVPAEECQSAPDVDIAKGQESVIISLVNEVNNDCPPSFHYIPQNAVFQNAYLNFSLARIGDDNCCSTCLGDCLSSSTPCACALQSGGEFAYTSEGLVREELLKECISVNRNPQKHCLFYCSECPLERSKNEEIIEPCKGHAVRKFIKECWWKCGCSKQCGNRVVQRGISRKLQVFMTPGGKGWGLRTLEDLPKGAFVCEYVGEVLTNAELYDRVSRSSNKDEHAYPVLLDADWASESDLKDEEALCLDATHFGNVARFINHRCFDSTLVEIPVEVETPDHHYYHLAFFTTRKVKALEELTWDYGIDFDDHEHPVKAFKCRCGSKFCRNIKRHRRARFGRR